MITVVFGFLGVTCALLLMFNIITVDTEKDLLWRFAIVIYVINLFLDTGVMIQGYL